MSRFEESPIAWITGLTLVCGISLVSTDAARSQGLTKLFDLEEEMTWCDWLENGYGSSLAVGDLNGDDRDDVIVSNSWNGAYVNVYYGTPTGVSETPTRINVDSGHVATADVNDDSIDDLIIGTGGTIYAFYGRESSLGGLDPDYFAPVTTSTWTTPLVARAGDVNGDGVDDLIIGLPNEDKAVGFYGSSSGLPADKSLDFIVEGQEGWQDGTLYNVSGSLGAAVGKDGHSLSPITFDNFITGVPYADIDSNGDGVFWSSELSANQGLALIGPRWSFLTGDAVLGAQFGYALGSAGDVNGDGHPDVIVSAKKTSSAQAKIFVYLGTSDRVDRHSYGWSVEGVPGVTSESDDGGFSWFGDAVGSAGDINGDGYGDIFIGDPRHDGVGGRSQAEAGWWGAFRIWFGGPSTPGDASGLGAGEAPQDADLIAEGGPIAGLFGDAFAAGDFNGDGVGDLVVGDPRSAGACYDPDTGQAIWGVETGRAVVYLSTYPPPTSDEIFSDGFESGDTSAWSATVP